MNRTRNANTAKAVKKNHTRKLGVVVFVFLMSYSTSYSEYGDVVLDRYKDTMAEVGLSPVVFPHWTHRIQFKCKACHESCGNCHNGKIAWDPLYCDRCHSLSETDDKQ